MHYVLNLKKYLVHWHILLRDEPSAALPLAIYQWALKLVDPTLLYLNFDLQRSSNILVVYATYKNCCMKYKCRYTSNSLITYFENAFLLFSSVVSWPAPLR